MPVRRAARTVAVLMLMLTLVASACVGADTGTGTGTGTSAEATAASAHDPSDTGDAVVVTSLSPPTEVGPAPTHPAFGLDRDAGVSARLRDGSVVWFFGDTARVNPDWSLEYFVIGTASWAPADAPTRTTDALVSGQPLPFVGPDATARPCTPAAPVPGAWPYAAVVVPDGDRDRVLVWIENICLGQTQNVESRGMAVGEWVYDPDEDHADRHVELTPLGRLADDRWYGYAAALGEDGWIDTFYCDRWPTLDASGNPVSGPACHVARVRPDEVADPARYRPWTSEGWGGDGPPAPLDLPAPAGGTGGPDEIARPPGSFSVNFHTGLDRYVMAYSPWPGSSGELHLRFADRPEGPWSVPQVVELPGCLTTSDGREFRCYAGSLQPFLDRGTEIGVGYYDRIRDEEGVRGNYMVARLATEPG